MVEELSDNPMLGRHIEPRHIKLSLPAVEKLCPCCNTEIDPSRSLVTVDQELADFFRGHVLAAGTHFPGDLERKASSLDLGPLDFRHVVDSLRMLYCQCEEDFRGALIKRDIKAVRLNCEADTQFMDRAGIEGVLEPKSLLLAESEIPTPVADKIGMPLIVRKLPPAVAWRDPRRPCRLINDKSGMLNPPHQCDHTGSLVLVRKDGKPLHPMHVHALLDYTAEKLKNPNLTGNACITADMLLPSLIDHVSKEDFQNYYTTVWQTCPIHNHFVPSPFDIQAEKDHEGADVNMNDD
ncbi:hypothetical protein BDU57DRAFT_515552 [Ampelomyces quisqualis]|uniref:Uncharacterized protein n=1 Tax=Ampelomyces quisqualis TaxID=50730 RepID=A0A6A5QKA5_AMPQU|nr:hypothetical protein BDU57DRAFT_515552 [Ampelomyces quisqualis]